MVTLRKGQLLRHNKYFLKHPVQLILDLNDTISLALLGAFPLLMSVAA